MVKLYVADAMFLVVRPIFIKLALLLVNVHTNRPLLHSPVFDAAPYRLTPLLDLRLSLGMAFLVSR
jgi:hypothetical protein